MEQYDDIGISVDRTCSSHNRRPASARASRQLASPACLRVIAAKWTSQPSLPEGTMPEMRDDGFGMSGPQSFVFRIPQRFVLLDDCRKALAEDLDFQFGSGLGKVGAQHAERDRFVHTVAEAS